ncbi:MAG: glycosyltransferase family 39 protein [Chloroflexota bacterium]
MKRGQERKKRPFPVPTLISITIILLLGFWLRIWHIDAFSFWSDEGLTPLRSGYSVIDILRNVILIQGHVTKDTHPAFFYLTIHFTRQLFGETDFAFRYPSVLFSTLLIALLYRFGKKLASPKLGLVIAFFMAINPLHIWYANEARMYAIYSLLVAAASYLLWRAISITDASGPSIFELIRQRKFPLFYRYLVGYGLLAGLSLYTNYTAVFLIAAQGLIWAWLFWKRGHLRDILLPAILVLAIGLPNVGDTLPRLFSGAEANFFFVPPAIMLQDVFRFFSLGLTFSYGQFTLGLFTALAALLTLFGVLAAKNHSTRIFLLTYLFAVVFGLMAGQLIKPMYQGARHIMVGSPAFVILIGMGLLGVWEWGIGDWRLGIGDRFQNRQHLTLNHWLLGIGYWMLVAGITFTALFGPLHSLYNYYRDPAFAKDDLRGMIQFIERSAGANDAIVYNNAILLPLHEHYRTRSDTAVSASPSYPKWAGFVSVEELTAVSAQVDHIWFITDPPTDNRDFHRVAKGWLDDNLSAIETFHFHARTTALNVVLYRAESPHQDSLPDTAVSLNQSWADNLTVAGIQLFPPTADSNLMLIDLYWQGPFDPNELALKTLRFGIVGPDQREWVVHNRPFLAEPSDIDTTSSQLFRSSYQLALPDGLPPAKYEIVLLGVDENGVSVSNQQVTAAFDLTNPVLAQWDQPLIEFENEIQLSQFELADLSVRPGNNLPLTLFWLLPSENNGTNELIYEIKVIDESGAVLRHDLNKVGPDWLESLPSNTAVRENNSLYIYPEAVPGDYTVQIQLREGEQFLNRQSWNPFQRNSQPQTVAHFTVEPFPLNTEMPAFETAVSAQFSNFITLAGYDLEQTAGQLGLTFYWQTNSQPNNNYLIFIHLVNEAGEIVQQVDQVPVGGLRPTGTWRPNEVLVDAYTMPLPSELESGTYQLRLGFSLPETFDRLPVSLADSPQPDNQLELTTIVIP